MTYSGYLATLIYQEAIWLIQRPGRQQICWGLEDQSLSEVQNVDLENFQYETTRDVTLRSAHMIIKKTFQDEIKHQRIKTVYSKINKEEERTIKNREDQMTLAQIRSGKHMAFQAYKHQVESDTPGNCPRCEEDKHTLEH